MPVSKNFPPREQVRVRTRRSWVGYGQKHWLVLVFKNSSRLVGRLRSEVRVSASFIIFGLTAGGGCPRWGGQLSGRGTVRAEYIRGGNVEGNVLGEDHNRHDRVGVLTPMTA